MYLWRPNDTEIENYRISEYIESLKEYIRKYYVEPLIFEDYYGMLLVRDKNKHGPRELGFISKIEELK